MSASAMPSLDLQALCAWADFDDARAMVARGEDVLALLDASHKTLLKGSSTMSVDAHGVRRPSSFGTRFLHDDGRAVDLVRGRTREEKAQTDDLTMSLQRPDQPPIVLNVRMPAEDDPTRPAARDARMLAEGMIRLGRRILTVPRIGRVETVPAAERIRRVVDAVALLAIAERGPLGEFVVIACAPAARRPAQIAIKTPDSNILLVPDERTRNTLDHLLEECFVLHLSSRGGDGGKAYQQHPFTIRAYSEKEPVDAMRMLRAAQLLGSDHPPTFAPSEA